MLSRQLLQHSRPRYVNTTASRIYYYRAPRRAPAGAARFYSSSPSKPLSSSSPSPSPSSSWAARALIPLAAGAAGLAVGLYHRKDPSSSSSSGSRDHHQDNQKVEGKESRSGGKTKTTASPIAIPDLNQLGLSDQITYSPPPTSDDVTRQLNESAWTCRPEEEETGLASAVSRYDGAQLGSNSPCEDAYLHGRFASPLSSTGSSSSDWMAWAVFDGHCGWQMSDLLTKQLVPFVRRALGDAAAAAQSSGGGGGGAVLLSEDAIHGALKTAFTTLDDSVVKTAAATIESDLPFGEKARRLEAAYAGACALLALFDPATRTLRVASAGDCRAVLGSRRRRQRRPPGKETTTTGDDGKNDGGDKSAKWEWEWEATDLTTDHTGANPDEVARLRERFPDEPGVVAGGRVWGMQPSRTFGDGMWKWTARLKRTLRERYNGLGLPSAARYRDYRDGPYLTAEPAVATARIPGGCDIGGDGDGDEGPAAFLILATDGLWDTMTSAQAVDLVGRWLDRRDSERKQQKAKEEPGSSSSDFGPTILGWKQSCKYEENKATVRDENAAVHLIRNGLGGADEEMVRGALTFRYPNSRDIRDDITVQVVFFSSKPGGGGRNGESGKEGGKLVGR